MAGVAVLCGFKAAGAGGAHGLGCGPAVAAKAPLRYAGTLRGDVDGDGRADRVSAVRASASPSTCRFALVVRAARRTLVAPIHTPMLDRDRRLEMIRELKVPALYALARIDRRPGAEIVAVTDRGASTLPLAVFTFRAGSLRPVRAPVSTFLFGAVVKLGSGVDCTRGREPGDIVRGGFWAGNRFGTWHVQRTFYAVKGDGLRRVGARHVVLHGRNPRHLPYLRFHELGGDAFRSCTIARNAKVW